VRLLTVVLISKRNKNYMIQSTQNHVQVKCGVLWITITFTSDKTANIYYSVDWIYKCQQQVTMITEQYHDW